MIPDVVLVTAAVVTTAIALVFAVWSFRAYVDFKRSQRTMSLTMRRFAAIRAGTLDRYGHSLPPEDLDVDALVKLLFEMQSENLADVPRDLIARAGQLGSKK